MNDAATTAQTPATEQQSNRRSLRVPYSRDHIPVVLFEPDGSQVQMEATGRNISKGGVGVLIEREVARGTKCQVEMQSLTGKKSRHEATVVFVRPVHGALYEIGLAFSDLIDLEQHVTLQRVQRMIYEKEKKAAAEKAQRIIAHAAAQAAGESGPAPAMPAAATARPIISKLADQPAKHEELQAYLGELTERTARLTAAAEQADLQAMLAITQWVIDTAQSNGFPTLFAVASAVVTYLEDHDADVDFARGQVMALVGYLNRARAAA